ncbi:MAG: urease accessory protein UreF [Betaproteobacteria bacterium]|nr:MAG: urease accessory protein UreF [Betaproteobacteria bacterium]
MNPRLLQLASPALPVGAYSYSQGLEWAIETGAVNCALSAAAWITDHLRLVFSRFEIPLYAQAFVAWQALPAAHDELLQLNAEFLATRESSEPRAESIQVGFSYAAWCREVAPLCAAQRETLAAINSPCAPVAASLAAAACRLTARDGAMAYTFGFAENQVMVLAKALPMGQIAAQKLLFSLATAVEQGVDTALGLSREDWCSAAPLLAIAQMKHESQYSRLFRS